MNDIEKFSSYVETDLTRMVELKKRYIELRDRINNTFSLDSNVNINVDYFDMLKKDIMNEYSDLIDKKNEELSALISEKNLELQALLDNNDLNQIKEFAIKVKELIKHEDLEEVINSINSKLEDSLSKIKSEFNEKLNSHIDSMEGIVEFSNSTLKKTVEEDNVKIHNIEDKFESLSSYVDKSLSEYNDLNAKIEKSNDLLKEISTIRTDIAKINSKVSEDNVSTINKIKDVLSNVEKLDVEVNKIKDTMNNLNAQHESLKNELNLEKDKLVEDNSDKFVSKDYIDKVLIEVSSNISNLESKINSNDLLSLKDEISSEILTQLKEYIKKII